MKLLLVVAAALAVASCDDDATNDMEFQAWQDHHRSSDNFTAEERMSRMSIWLRNREVVQSHNTMADEGNSSYRLGMTNFADIENDEFKEMLSCRCLHAFNASRARNLSPELQMLEKTSIPETFNWMDAGYVTPVKNQGRCGSCWAFSTTGSLEGQTFRKTGRLVSLSEQQLVDCSGGYGNIGCSGGLMGNAFSYIMENRGLNAEADYPYEAENGICRHDPNNTAATCSGFVDIPEGDEEAMKVAVATVGPISVAIDASLLSFQLYNSGVYDTPFCSSTNLGHAVLVVGYGTEDGKDYWLVKNSWGTEWGDQGYIKMRRNKQNQCGIATLSTYPLV